MKRITPFVNYALSELVIIVGYATSTLTGGATPIAMQFGAISGDYKLEDIKPVGSFDSDEISIDIIGFDGMAEASYTWINWGGDTGDVECWSPDGSGEVAEGVTFPAGQGFIVNGGTEDAGIQSAGQVLTDDVVVQLNGGATATGNPFPIDMNINAIFPSGTFDSDEITIDVIGFDGMAEASYTWINWGGDTGDIECWSPDGSGEVATDVIIPAGKGLVVNGGSEEAYLNFSAPEL